MSFFDSPEFQEMQRKAREKAEQAAKKSEPLSLDIPQPTGGPNTLRLTDDEAGLIIDIMRSIKRDIDNAYVKNLAGQILDKALNLPFYVSGGSSLI